jgi:iron-sulfur cluster assembly protein
MIQVSDTASKKIVDMMKDDGFDAAVDYVRVGVKSGGCSGLSYELKFDKEIGETDKVFEVNNVRIAVEKKSFLYLAGTILEFSGGLNGKDLYLIIQTQVEHAAVGSPFHFKF